jgi:hypothetical protein
MKKPYIKKIGDVAGFHVWYVNGYWIRNNLDRQFPNYGWNRTFVFIPKDEIWIEYPDKKKEAKFFIDMFLAMDRAYKNGKTHTEAVKIANRVEARERNKVEIIKRYRKIKVKKIILDKVHKQPFLKKYSKNISIWIVKGNLVRSLFNVDFNQGGHHQVYPFIPEQEIWIDDEIYKKERPFVLIHELHERKLMLKGWHYDPVGQNIFIRKKQAKTKSAHFVAEELEFWCRNHPKSIRKILLKEIKDNEEETTSKKIKKS